MLNQAAHELDGAARMAAQPTSGEGALAFAALQRGGSFSSALQLGEGLTGECQRLAVSMVREVRLAWSFIRYDFSATLVPATLFTMAAWKASGAVWSELPQALLRSLTYFLLYTLCFCIPGQVADASEDRLNKPDRPFVRGEVTQREAMTRWGVYMVGFTLVGYGMGVLGWTLLWQAVGILHNILNGARYWLVKNLCMALGTAAMLAVAWTLVAPLTTAASHWVTFVALIVFPLISLQDLRDIIGDRVVGRRTFPIVWGENVTRWFLAVGYLALAVATHYILLAPFQGWRALVCDVALALIALTISVRVVLLRGREADHRTYLLFTYWYCCSLASALLVF